MLDALTNGSGRQRRTSRHSPAPVHRRASRRHVRRRGWRRLRPAGPTSADRSPIHSCGQTCVLARRQRLAGRAREANLAARSPAVPTRLNRRMPCHPPEPRALRSRLRIVGPSHTRPTGQGAQRSPAVTLTVKRHGRVFADWPWSECISPCLADVPLCESWASCRPLPGTETSSIT